MHRMYRAHGDPFPDLPDQVRPFQSDSSRYSTDYFYPATFDRGTGRVLAINNMLLTMFGDIGTYLNDLSTLKYDQSPYFRGDRARRIEYVTTKLHKSCCYATTLIGEIIAIGGYYHIPRELRLHVSAPNVTSGCLPQFVNQLHPEEYPIPANLPSVQANTSTSRLSIFGNPSLLPQNMGKVNSWLSFIYGNLAMVLNRVDYIDKVSVTEFGGILPESHCVTMTVHLRSMHVWFDRALLLISLRRAHGATMFAMPTQLRELVLTRLCGNMIYPVNDVTCLYRSVINVPVPVGHTRLDSRMGHLNLLVLRLDAVIATLSSRLRAFLTVRFPELARIIIRNDLSYARLATFIVGRSILLDEDVASVIDIVGCHRVASDIVNAVNASIGPPLTEVDIAFVNSVAGMVTKQLEYRQERFQDLRGRMMNLAPNLTSLMGCLPALRLIDWAGSLQNLASLQVSQIKFLGTERLPNRPLGGGITQDRGVLFGHQSFRLVGSSSRKRRKVAADLSQMCHNAVRVDLNSNEPTSNFGECLIAQIGETVDFLNSKPFEEDSGASDDSDTSTSSSE